MIVQCNQSFEISRGFHQQSIKQTENKTEQKIAALTTFYRFNGVHFMSINMSNMNDWMNTNELLI